MQPEDQQPKDGLSNIGSLESPVQSEEKMQSESSSTQQPKKSSSKLLIIIMVVLLIAAIVAGFYVYASRDTQKTASTITENTAATESEESGVISYTYISSLEHQTTVEFEHPKTWEIKVTEDEYIEGSKLKYMVIGSEKGNYLHIFDRDGIGGYCEPNDDSYTVKKILPTRSDDLFFKEFSAPSEPDLDGILLLEVTRREWSDPEHENLKETETSTDTCKLPSFSTVGSSGVTIMIRNTEDPTAESSRRLGWDDIKDDEEFVVMLQSIVAIDKSEL